LGSRTAFAAAARPAVRMDGAVIPAKRPGAPGRPVSPEDREWLHRPPIP
jgi:hypothetical protein